MKYRTINITAKTHDTLMRIKKIKAKKEGVCTSFGTIILDAVKTKYPEECGMGFCSVDENDGENG